MRNLLLISIIAFCAAGAAQAKDYISSPGQARTSPIDGNLCEVVGKSSRGHDMWWCGAATYVRRVLGAGWTTPVTIARGLGQSQATGRRSSVQFTLNPSALGIQTLKSSFPNQLEVGDTRTVQDGNLSCQRVQMPF